MFIQPKPDFPDILARIVEAKRQTVDEIKDVGSFAELRARALAQPPGHSFLNALRPAPGQGGIRLIAEVKKASPSAGVLLEDFDPVWLAKEYQAGGAAAVSVLTEEKFFQGALFHLSAVRAVIDLPVLMKDFILDEVQLCQGRIAGADAALLIAAILKPDRLAALIQTAAQLGLDALVEVRDETDLNLAIGAGARIIGINNRDLRDFRVDLAVSERLAKLVPADKILVSESGISSAADIGRLKKAGFSAFLVGTSLVTSGRPGVEVQKLIAAGR